MCLLSQRLKIKVQNQLLFVRFPAHLPQGLHLPVRGAPGNVGFSTDGVRVVNSSTDGVRAFLGGELLPSKGPISER